MSKLNPSSKGNSMDLNVRVAGGTGAHAAKQSNIELLRRLTLANLLWEDIAYADGKSVSDEIATLIPRCNPEDVANLAVECRVKQKLRHTPLFIVSEMTKYNNFRGYVKDILPKIVTRADMLCDFLAIYWKDKKHPLANCVKKGLANAFHNFDEYQFAKYDRDAVIKLRDVIRMVHPVPRDEKESELFKKITDRTLATPDTWEVAISATKSDAEKTSEWTRLIENNRLGGLAFLRNMKNFINCKVGRTVIENGLKHLKGSMLLPLDYIKAARNASQFTREIENAMLESYKHLPKLPGKTLFILDKSGSMGVRLSEYSDFTRLDAACAMAMLASNVCEDFSLVITAGSDDKCKHSSQAIECPPRGFGMSEIVERCDVGYGGIFTRQVLEWSKEQFSGTEFDRIIVFSDSQDMDWKDKTPHPFGKNNYICDVSSHSHGINYRGVWTAEISGWSEHFLTYIAAVEGLSNEFETQQ